MAEGSGKKPDWKKRMGREFTQYLINFVYLAVFFAFFTWYRRLVLAEYHIAYLHYGMGLVEALVLAKVIMIGDILHLGRRFEDKPLILPTLFKTLIFGVLVAAFAVVEHSAEGLLHGKGAAGGLRELLGLGGHELLARCLVVFFAFIPFFAFKELGRVFGEAYIAKLFFRGRPGKSGMKA